MPELKLPVLAVLGLAGVAADWLSLAVFSLIVALSTVFWRLKFELVVLWLLLVVRGTAVGGPGGWGGSGGVSGHPGKIYTTDRSVHGKSQSPTPGPSLEALADAASEPKRTITP